MFIFVPGGFCSFCGARVLKFVYNPMRLLYLRLNCINKINRLVGLIIYGSCKCEADGCATERDNFQEFPAKKKQCLPSKNDVVLIFITSCFRPFLRMSYKLIYFLEIYILFLAIGFLQLFF